jgi:hypothetical protein
MPAGDEDLADDALAGLPWVRTLDRQIARQRNRKV